MQLSKKKALKNNPSDDKQSENNPAASVQKQNLSATTRTHKKKLILGISGIVLVIIFITGWKVYDNQKYQAAHAAVSVCSDDILKQAGSLLDPSKSQQLGAVVKKIESLKDYDKDPNCLNVVTTYYINISDYANAQKNFELLKQRYDDKQGFSKALGYDTRNMQQLSQGMDFLKVLNDAAMKNTRYAVPQENHGKQ